MSTLTPGFSDPVRDAQACFRALLEATAHPGRVVAVDGPADAPFGVAMASVALTLLDADTPVWLGNGLDGAAEWLRFHTGSRIVADAGEARFAFAATLGTLDGFDLGTDEDPDRSATIVLAVTALGAGRGLTLCGPGIDGTTRLLVDGLPDALLSERAVLHRLFPRGLDLVLTSGDRLACLPRTTRVLGD